MKQAYKATNFREPSLKLIAQMNRIIADYQQQGYTMTMRQLYYRLVAADIVPNTLKSYKNITGLGNDARLAGLMDWEAIEDRTREMASRNHWSSPAEVIRACADQFHMDMWHGQDHRLLVIVEKEALAGVVERACTEVDVPFLAARGYPSVTILREIVQSYFRKAERAGQDMVILHLGDHDPSGIDMSRDLEERFRLFADSDAPDLSIDFKRLALNMPQVEELKPPPNPAKTTDSRFESYLREYGDESWELDALEPSYLNILIDSNVRAYINEEQWEAREAEIESGKERLADAAAKMEDEDQ